MPRYTVCLTGLFLVLTAVNAAAQEPAGEEAGVMAARAWLGLANEGEYARRAGRGIRGGPVPGVL